MNPFEKKEEEKLREIGIIVIDREPTEKERLIRKNRILEEHGGLESNIPINSEYWRM